MRRGNRLRLLFGMIAMLGVGAWTQAGARAGDPLPPPPENLRPHFAPPPAFAGDFGSYRSPLRFDDGRPVRDRDDWHRRRQEILRYWHDVMGPWPPLLEKPSVEVLESVPMEGYTRHRVRVALAPDRRSEGYLLVPHREGRLPAVVVVYYDPETAVGLAGRPLRDFALQLARRGFVTLSLGSPYTSNYPAAEGPVLQPLSYLAYLAANAWGALAARREVDPERIGIVGHSYGGKWAMFASCLFEKFACAVWSDPGIVFDETRPNVNYWEPWYLGFERGFMRERGVPGPQNPRTGAYRRLVEEGRDLHELHALMAPRPFLVSGGSEDPPERWRALNHTVAVNRLLRFEHRVAMTNRPGHDPTPESNEQIYSFFEWALRSGRPAPPGEQEGGPAPAPVTGG